MNEAEKTEFLEDVAAEKIAFASEDQEKVAHELKILQTKLRKRFSMNDRALIAGAEEMTMNSGQKEEAWKELRTIQSDISKMLADRSSGREELKRIEKRIQSLESILSPENQ
ncbi:MAG: hypothetical protein ABI430_00870 [Candidatus Taylorbacteria bacterium]